MKDIHDRLRMLERTKGSREDLEVIEAYTQTRPVPDTALTQEVASSSLRSSKEKRHGSHQHGATKRCRAGVAAVIGIESRRIRLRVGVAHLQILESWRAFSITSGDRIPCTCRAP